ncbi:MAG TPA: hypothetical protein DCY13_11630 [Verrucomicrobiales bacterium]|nr:hypothetical protein [Verrucomicrobiales bacterium]
MNGSGNRDPQWSPRRWTVTIGLFFALQAGLAWKLADPAPVQTRGDELPFHIRHLPESQSVEVATLLNLIDPTRFVLPSRQGFSGPAWLEMRPLVHQSPGWSSPPEWLRFNPNGLLGDLATFGETNHPVRASVAEFLTRPPEERVALSDSLLPPAETRFALRGDVSRADLTGLPALPSLEHSGVLSPSVVSLSIDERGRVFALALRESSGSAAADQQAVAIGRSLRFNVRPGFPAAQSRDDFGRLRRAFLTIHWWTRPPTATNPPAVPPTTVQPLP